MVPRHGEYRHRPKGAFASGDRRFRFDRDPHADDRRTPTDRLSDGAVSCGAAGCDCGSGAKPLNPLLTPRARSAANCVVHREVWPDRQSGGVEVGPCFEDGPVSTAADPGYSDARIAELKHILGTEVELDRWSGSRGHLHYLVPPAPPDLSKPRQNVGLLTSMIAVLRPLVREASVPQKRYDQPTGGRRYYGRVPLEAESLASLPGRCCERILGKVPSSAENVVGRCPPLCRRFGTWTG
jgi:hypothetical protein